MSSVFIEFVLTGLETFLVKNVTGLNFNNIFVQPLFFVRYGKDLLVFSYSINDIFRNLDLCKDFFRVRGLLVNNDSYSIKSLINESFEFLGFRFKAKFSSAFSKVFLSPSSNEITKLMRRMVIIFEKNNKFQLIKRCFIHINFLLYRWTNFYRIGNSKKAFRKISILMWDYVSAYFQNIYMKLPEFRKKVVYNRKNRVTRYIFKIHTKKYGKIKRWWYVTDFSDRKVGIKQAHEIFLICPSQISTLDPNIIICRDEMGLNGLNSFYTLDRLKLSKQALIWKFGLERQILGKTNGYCTSCHWNLLFEDEFIDIFTFLLYFKREFRLSDPFCLLCFKKLLKTKWIH